jgi:hypothetical protein
MVCCSRLQCWRGVFFVRCEIFAYPSNVTHKPLNISFVPGALLSVILKPRCILGPFVLFTHFLEHLFSLIMGRSEKPNMGLPILGSQYLVNYFLWVM